MPRTRSRTGYQTIIKQNRKVIFYLQKSPFLHCSSSSRILLFLQQLLRLLTVEQLLDRGTKPERYFKAKSDYVTEPMPSHVWESAWSWLRRDGAGLLIMDPYGGRMRAVAPSATPFPHRRELYNLQYYGFWFDNGTEAKEKHVGWITAVHREMEPYVSKNPRGAYVNYRDLDLGVNDDDDDHHHGGLTSYGKARVWGETYFKANFERLAAVKAKVDPHDFFRHEQSIPPLVSNMRNL